MNEQKENKNKKAPILKTTVRQQRLARIITDNLTAIKPMTQKDMLLKAGYSLSTAHAAPMVMKNAGIQRLLRQSGISDKLVATKLREGLDATSLHGKDAIEHPDFNARHKYLNTALELKGMINQPKNNNKTNILASNASITFE